MKYITLFLVGAALVFTVAYAPQLRAQTTWVICENIMNGQRQSFPNQCPSGWFFVSY